MTTMPTPTGVCHFTHIDNLPSILSAGALCAKNVVRTDGLDHRVDVSNPEIQAGLRQSRPVTCGPGGVIHDYVPFYFAPRSPMLFYIHCNGVQGGQRPQLFFASTVQKLEADGAQFVFTDRNAAVLYSAQFDDLSLLPEKVDWTVVRRKYWNGDSDDAEIRRDCKQRRMAEFLVYERVPLSSITEIGTLDQGIADQVTQQVAQAGLNVRVNVRSEWYF